jgi:hypothetical protein
MNIELYKVGGEGGQCKSYHAVRVLLSRQQTGCCSLTSLNCTRNSACIPSDHVSARLPRLLRRISVSAAYVGSERRLKHSECQYLILIVQGRYAVMDRCVSTK